MDIYSSDYMIFMSEAYAEAYDEMIKWNNEQVLEEKSHGKLQFDYRYGFDYDTGHAILIVYELKNAIIDMAGHAYSNFKANSIEDINLRSAPEILKQVKDNIATKGDLDHASHGQQVLAIIDRKDKTKLKSSRVIGLFNDEARLYFDMLEIGYSRLKMIWRDHSKNEFPLVEVGKIDNTSSFKTTKYFKAKDYISSEGDIKNPSTTKLSNVYSIEKNGRGAKLDDVVPYPYQKTPYAHPSKKDWKKFNTVESVDNIGYSDSFMETMGWLFEADDEEDEEEEKEVSNAVYKINYYFKKNLQEKYITPILEKRRNRDLIMDFTAKFIDDHHTALSAPGPMYSFTFGKPETSFFYNLFNLTEDMILDIYANVIKETYYGKISSTINGFIVNAPHKLLITGMLVDAFQHEYDDIVECCEYLWAFCEYPILFKKFWSIGVNEEVMKYTIEHLPGKFKIINKKLTTLQALLKYDSNTAIAPYKEPMKTDGADHLYINLVRSIRNQIKATFKNIARLYYDNAEKNNTQHQSVSEFDDGTMADQEGINSNISQIVEKTCTKFASKEVNGAIVKACAEMSQVDKGNLTGYISQIFSVKNNKVSKFVENIITAYFTKNPSQTEIDSSEFINYGLAMYRSIGTSKDPLFSEIKLILNYWMNDIIQIRESYSREATIINYTRAIYNYFILMIKHYN